MDVTNVFANPDFEAGDYDGWVINGPVSVVYASATNNYQGTYFMEAWTGSDGNLGDFDWSQTVNMPNGYYVVKALAHAIKQNQTTTTEPHGVYVYAEESQTQVTTTTAAEYSVFTTVTDGSLTIGLRGTECNSNWVACDHFRVIQITANSEEAAKTEWAKYEMRLLSDELCDMLERSMYATLKDEIQKSIGAIESVSSNTVADALWKRMKWQKEEAETCINSYEQLSLRIDDILTEVNKGADKGYDTANLHDAVDVAKSKYDNGLLDAAGALAEIKVLNDALFEYYMSIADGTTPFDITEMYVANPTLRENSNGWSGNKPALEYEVMEFWNCDFDIYQELTGMPNGKYMVTVQGFYRESNNDAGAAYAAGAENITAKLYANNAVAPLVSLYKYKASEMGVTVGVQDDYVNMLNSTNMAFNTYNSLQGVNYYAENKVEVVVFDGTLRFGLRDTDHKSGSWCTFRDFQLFYYGNFPNVDLAGKIPAFREYIEESTSAIPYAVNSSVSDYLRNIEDYTVKGSYSDDEVNAVILQLDSVRNETLKAIDLFAELHTIAAEIQNALLPLDYPGKDELNAVLENMAPYFSETSTVNTYDNMQTLKAEVEAAIMQYYFSQEASPEIAADYTPLISNPNFEEKGEWTWSVVADGFTDLWIGECRPTEEGGVNRQGVSLWSWGITSVDVHQTLTGLPNGLYKVSAEMITQTNYATDQHVYAAGANTAISDYLTVEGWNNYEWTTLTTNDFAVVVDGTLTIGAATTQGGSNSEGWFQATNFKLYYYGKASDVQLKTTWENIKARADKALEILLPNEKKELEAAMKQAVSLVSESKYEEACLLVLPIVEALDSTVTATEKFYGGYYAHLDTLETSEGYEGYTDIHAFSDAVVALADEILGSDTTTCKIFDALNLQLHAYVNYAAALRDAEKAINDTENLYPEEFEAFVIDSVITPQTDSLLLKLRDAEYCDDMRDMLDKAVNILKSTINFTKKVNEGDVSYLIINPTIDGKAGEAPQGWTVIKNNAISCGTNNYEHYSGDTKNTYLDAWAANGMNATFSQELNGIPDGLYRLTVAARTNGNDAYIYAATTSSTTDTSTQWLEVQNNGSYGEDYGWSWHVIDNIEVTNHFLSVGLTADSKLSGKNFNGTWMSADDWKLELIEKSEFQSEYKPFIDIKDNNNSSENDNDSSEDNNTPSQDYYLLTFIVDEEIVQIDTMVCGATIILPDVPIKEGYTFSGWSEYPQTMPANDVTVSGSYVVNKYRVSFMIGAVELESYILEYGSEIVAPDALELPGYTFCGWGEVAQTVPAYDVVYYADYIPQVYSVFYFVKGQLVHVEKVSYGEVIPEYIYEPTDEGEVFVRWNGDIYETMPAHDISYTAGIATGMDEVENSKLKIENSVIYDLSGRKIVVDDLRELQKGVYIINGRKMIIE